MKHGVQSILRLGKAGEFKAAFLCRTACTPCNANRKWVELREAGYTGEKVVCALDPAIYQGRARTNNVEFASHLVGSGREELEVVERPVLRATGNFLG